MYTYSLEGFSTTGHGRAILRAGAKARQSKKEVIVNRDGVPYAKVAKNGVLTVL